MKSFSYSFTSIANLNTLAMPLKNSLDSQNLSIIVALNRIGKIINNYKILTLFLILATCSSLNWADTSAKDDYQSFIPKNWKVLNKVEGDLNGDQQPDLALIIENNAPQNIVATGSLDGTELNLNNRKLLILFKNHDGYRLVASNSTLPTEDDQESPCLSDPLKKDSLSIENNQLKITLNYSWICGSWYAADYIFKFKYQNKHLKLIHYDALNFNHGSTQTYTRSFNFLTGKIKNTSENTSNKNGFENKAPTQQISWSKLNNSDSLKIEQINFKDYI